jgi:hypothetical protein
MFASRGYVEEPTRWTLKDAASVRRWNSQEPFAQPTDGLVVSLAAGPGFREVEYGIIFDGQHFWNCFGIWFVGRNGQLTTDGRLIMRLKRST